MAMKVFLVVIDGQNDFCDPNGSLFVKGGDEDAKRIARLIDRLRPKLADVILTMDSHRIVDISHPMWWMDDHGNAPKAFTAIAASDVEAGKWRTRQPSARGKTLKYLQALESGKRYPHVIWPEHCLIGDDGHNLHPAIAAAVHEWERQRYAVPTVVTKGSNPWTEHFSAVRAEVPDAEDPSTQVNRGFIEMLENADVVAWTGEALSHCLANTFRDAVSCFNSPTVTEKMVLLTDATSNVPGFDAYGEQFIRDMTAKGMKTATTADFLA